MGNAASSSSAPNEDSKRPSCRRPAFLSSSSSPPDCRAKVSSIGCAQAFRLIGKHKPNVVLGVGGYSSGAVLAAAKLRGVPTIIHEQNAFPGLTNRLLAKFVNAVVVAFVEAAPRLKRNDAIVTGNPIRAEFFTHHSSLITRHSRLLIFGGSQGSHILNETMTGALLFLAHLKDQMDIVHQTGANELAKVQQAYRTSAFANARVVAYLDPIVDEIAPER